MKKILIQIAVILMIFTLSLGLTSCESPDAEGSSRFPLYLYDIEKGSTAQLGDKLHTTLDIKWSEDNKHFMFINEGKYEKEKKLPDEVIVYRVKDLKEIKFATDKTDKDRYEYIDDFKWVNNGQIFISYRNSELASRTASYKIGEEEVPEVNEIPDWESSVKQIAAQDIINKVEGRTGSNFFEGYITNDEKELVCRLDGFNVYHMNMDTNKKELLFRGFNLQWSPDRTKVSYNIPKEDGLDGRDEYDSYDSQSIVTYIYDFKTGKSTKVADYGTSVFFSNDDKYIVFYECAYMGGKGRV